MEKRESTLKFYGGTIGPWIPVLFMLAGMLVSTVIGGGGLNRLTMISFFALALGFLLAKDLYAPLLPAQKRQESRGTGKILCAGYTPAHCGAGTF